MAQAGHGLRTTDLPPGSWRRGLLDGGPHHHRRASSRTSPRPAGGATPRSPRWRRRRAGAAPGHGRGVGPGRLARGAAARPRWPGPDHVRRDPSPCPASVHRLDRLLRHLGRRAGGHAHLLGDHGRHRRRPGHLAGPPGAASGSTVPDPEVDGVLFVQLDGVPFPVLRVGRPVRRGAAPSGAGWPRGATCSGRGPRSCRAPRRPASWASCTAPSTGSRRSAGTTASSAGSWSPTGRPTRG